MGALFSISGGITLYEYHVVCISVKNENYFKRWSLALCGYEPEYTGLSKLSSLLSSSLSDAPSSGGDNKADQHGGGFVESGG